jgi:hypothetical protein
MIDERELLEQAVRRFEPEPGLTGRIYHRRDRKRRNQRISAGVVGIAVFVAAVWIVTSGLSLDRSTPAVPGSKTGPAESAPTAAPDAGWEGQGLPPEGTALSTPVEGELIRRRSCRVLLFCTPVSVYADGRVLWFVGGGFSEGYAVLERRLTPEGVRLVRSGVIRAEDLAPPQVLHGVPASAWADDEPRPYAPPRYSVCFSHDPSTTMGLLPAPAEALLRGSGSDPSHDGCRVVTADEARTLDSILSEAGFFPGEPQWAGAEWFLREGGGVRISIMPLWPGTWVQADRLLQGMG